ncbi:MAG: AI-2E family transporter [Coriobacteriales bacterium]|nr:AI-2E family transporter [Coriobacteriales bacterium]
MRKPTLRELVILLGIALLFIVLFQSWDAVISFCGIVLTAIAPLVVGGAIAYVVSIPMNFLQRHLFSRSNSGFANALRQPLALLITVVVLLAILALCSSLLIPALIDTVKMVQVYGQDFVESVIQLPVLSPVRQTVHDFITGDFVQGLKNLDIGGAIQEVFGGTLGNVTTQVFTVVSVLMTGFFGMLFSFILLTDNTHATSKFMLVIKEYLGTRRFDRLTRVLTVADRSFHSFLVRQCVEASILGTVGGLVLLPTGFPYAIGVGALVGLMALIPIVGYPVGLVLGAFMVAIFNVWAALLFVLAVAIAQVLESTLLLPHVGDKRTFLPPVWITVAVTIGGGVGGFLGMLVAIPLGSTIRQLVLMDVDRRRAARMEQEEQAQATAETIAEGEETPAHLRS